MGARCFSIAIGVTPVRGVEKCASIEESDIGLVALCCGKKVSFSEKLGPASWRSSLEDS